MPPDLDGFNYFLAAHGGKETAYTAYETTVSSGEMSAGADGGDGQDRFADSFRAPSFDLESLEAVINSIEARCSSCTLSNPASVLGKFHTVNAHTLFRQLQSDGVGVGLCPHAHCWENRIRVVTFSSEPLEEQLRTADRQLGNIGARDNACQTSVLLAHMHTDNVPFRQHG